MAKEKKVAISISFGITNKVLAFLQQYLAALDMHRLSIIAVGFCRF
jgi:hypothetical protein